MSIPLPLGLLKPAEVVSKRLLLEKFSVFPKLPKLPNLPKFSTILLAVILWRKAKSLV